MTPGVTSTGGAAAMSDSPLDLAAILAVTTTSSVYRGALGGAVTTISSMTKSGACHAGGLSALAVADRQTIAAAPQNSLVALHDPFLAPYMPTGHSLTLPRTPPWVSAETWRNPKRVLIIPKRSGGPADETSHETARSGAVESFGLVLEQQSSATIV